MPPGNALESYFNFLEIRIGHVFFTQLGRECELIFKISLFNLIPRPDFSPLDREVIRKLKYPLRGRRFRNVDELKIAVAGEVDKLNKNQKLVGTTHLPFVWDEVIERGGNYVNKIHLDPNDHRVDEYDDEEEEVVEDADSADPPSTQHPPSGGSGGGYSGCTSTNCGPRTRSGRVRHDELKA